MEHRIRLSPFAVFLSVIAIVLTTLAVLTIATAHADKVMAQRFASVTAVRYELEKDGQMFLRELDQALQNEDADLPEGLVQEEDGLWSWQVEKDGYVLWVGLKIDEKKHRYQVNGWEVKKQWSGSDPIYDIWQGQGDGTDEAE